MDKRYTNLRQNMLVQALVSVNTTLNHGDIFKVFSHTVASTLTYTLPKARPGDGPFYFNVTSASSPIVIQPQAADSIGAGSAGASLTLPAVKSWFMGFYCNLAGNWSPIDAGSGFIGSSVLTPTVTISGPDNVEYLALVDTGTLTSGMYIGFHGSGVLKAAVGIGGILGGGTTTSDLGLLSVGGRVVVNATPPTLVIAESSGSPTLQLASSGGAGTALKLLGSSAAQGKNWLIGNQFNINDALEFTPSTANGGATFTTFAMKIAGNGNVTINTPGSGDALTVNGAVNSTSGYAVNDIAQTASFFTSSPGTITTTDTYLGNPLSIPANALAVGNQFRITVWGSCTSTVANTVQFTTRFGTAGTTADTALGTTGFAAATSGTGNAFVAVFMVYVVSIGGTGSMATGFVTNNSAEPPVGISTSTVNSNPVIATTTVNTTVASKLGISLKFSAATTSATINTVLIERLF